MSAFSITITLLTMSTITRGDPADLLVSAALLEESDADPGDRVSVEFTMFNDGGEDADEFLIGYFLSPDSDYSMDDIFLEGEKASEVEGGEFEEESEQLEIPQVSDGIYYILIVLDYTGAIPESDETNNTFPLQITIGDADPGACCLPDSSCVVTTPDNCAASNGTYQGDNVLCANVNCAPPTVACCLSPTTCVQLTSGDCIAADGTPGPLGSECGSFACSPSGACCLTDGTCEFTTPDDCVALGGTYQGDDTLCADVNCPLPTLACCFSQTSCIQLTVDNCIAADGTPGPTGSQCGTFICFPTGACCLPDGSCESTTPDDCAAQGGTYQGDDTLCADVNCPLPTGACCFPNGFCLDAITEADCLSADGVWGGFDSVCVDDNNDGVFENCAPGCVGDISGDGLVDGADLNIMLTNWGCPNPADNCQNSDLTADLNVDGADLNVLLSDWGCSG